MASKMHQQWFDTAAAGIIAQGGFSYRIVNGNQSCLYRGDNGRRCAWG